MYELVAALPKKQLIQISRNGDLDVISRKEMVNEIFIQLGYAKEKNLIELMEKKKIEEVARIADEFEFYEFNAWIGRYGYLNLKLEETSCEKEWLLPMKAEEVYNESEETSCEKEWILPLVLWTWKSGVCDGRIFKYREDYIRILQDCGELGKRIAQNMQGRFLFEIPLEELLGV